MCMRCPWMEVWLALWLAAGGDEWLEWKEILKTMGEKNSKKCKICLPTKNSDALERNIFVFCENYMLRNGNLGLKMGVSPCDAVHTKCPPPPPPVHPKFTFICNLDQPQSKCHILHYSLSCRDQEERSNSQRTR